MRVPTYREISGGTYSTQESDSDILVKVGKGTITLKDVYVTTGTININGETIKLEKNITLTDGNDSFENLFYNATINALGGNDTISNSRSNITISGGAGNDSITNSGYNVSISGGKGNDTISLGYANLIQYTSGDGKDLIQGFDADDTLSISGGSYSTQASGADILVKVGKGTITLKDVRTTTETININGETIELEKNFTLTKGNDSFENLFNNATINALGGNDSIRNSGDSVTIDGGGGNDYISNEWGDSVSIDGGAGNDSISNTGYSVTIDAGKGNDKIWNWTSSNVSINAGAGDDYVYNDGTGATITGGSGNDSISNTGYSVTIDGGTGNDSISNDGSVNVSISGGAGNDYIFNRIMAVSSGEEYDEGMDDMKTTSYSIITPDNVILSGGAGDDHIYNEGNSDIINSGDGNDYIYIKGIEEELDQEDVVIAMDYYVENNTINGGKGNDTIVFEYAEGNLIQYTEGDGNDVIYGFSHWGDDTLQIGDGTGFYSTQKSGSDLIVTVGDGKITLSGAADCNGLNIAGTEASWKLDGTTATYSSADKTFVTVTGVKSLSGISLSGSTVTVSKASLNKENVTISDGYTLKLGSDVTKSSNTKAWSLKNSTASYTQTTTKTGYDPASDGKSISYSKAKATETLATVKGVKSTKGLSVSGKKITLKNSALNKKVTVSGGYEFNFASDYKNATITGSSAADTITARGSKISVNGGKGNDTVKMLGDTTTVTGGKGSDVFVYSSGKNVIADYAEDDKISIGAAISKTTLSGSDVVFTGGKGSLTVKNAKGKTLNLIDAEGKEYPTVLGGTTLTLTNSAVSSLTVDNSIKVIDASTRTTDINITGNKLNNSIFGGTGNDYLDGGKGKDSLNGGKGDDIISGGAGDDRLYGVSGNDSISGGDGNDYLHGSKGCDTILGGKGNDLLYGGEDDDVLYGNAGNDTLRGAEGNDSLWGGAGADVFIHKTYYEISNIMDYSYADGDILQILKEDGTNATYSKAAFADNKLTLTIGDGSVIFNNVSSGDVININGTTKTIKGKTLK